MSNLVTRLGFSLLARWSDWHNRDLIEAVRQVEEEEQTYTTLEELKEQFREEHGEDV